MSAGDTIVSSKLGVRTNLYSLPSSCNLGSASCTPLGPGIHWPRPSKGYCRDHWHVSCSMMQGVCVCLCVRAHQPWLVPHSPPHLPVPEAVCGWERQGVSACSYLGLEPSPSLSFPSPPLCRPSSLSLFLFCCRFNSSSWTLSVIPERYLVFPLSVWHPSRSTCTFLPSGTMQDTVL